MPKDADTFLDLYQEKHKLKKKRDSLFLELQNAIFNLRTYKAVEDNFPEAFLFLPKQQNTSLAINLSEIRQKIQ